MSKYMTFEVVIKDSKGGKVIHRKEIGLCEQCLKYAKRQIEKGRK